MAPVPVYSASPINASKASGATPQTRGPEPSRGDGETSDGPTAAAPVPATTTSSGGMQSLPRAAPGGAGQAMPIQTGVPQPNNSYRPQPTRTEDTGSSQLGNENPPAPQPGAAPVPPGRESSLTQRSIPPPPRAGESAEHYRQAQAATTEAPRLPPQMAYAAPAATQPIQGRSSTAPTMPTPQSGGPYPTFLAGTDPNTGYANNPAGYQQGAGYSGFNRLDTEGPHNSSNWSSTGGQDQAGVWDTARKWAAVAGESLVAAENEVWKKINKG